MPRQRYEFIGQLDVLSPLHVGSGDVRFVNTVRGKDGKNPLPEVAAIMRDAADRPYIPGSTFKGLLRRIGEDIFGGPEAAKVEALFGAIKDDEGGGRPGAIIFRGASATELGDASHAPYALKSESGLDTGVFVAARTKIDEASGVADDHKLFHQEMVAPGANFPFRLLLDVKATPEAARQLAQDLVRILGRLASEEGEYIGKGQADGFGRVRLKADDIQVWRKSLQKSGAFDSANERPIWTNRAKAPPRGSLQSWSFDLTCPGPFAVLDSSCAARRTERDRDNNSRKPQLSAQRLAEKLPLLLGTSLSGALRARARWLGALDGIKDEETTLSDPSQIEALTPVQRLFGVTGFRGRISVERLVVDNAIPWNVSSVKIDRFSGGPIDNALFTTATFIETRIRFTLSLSARGGGGPDDPDLALAKKLAADIALNGLILGHGGNKGFGWFNPAEEN